MKYRIILSLFLCCLYSKEGFGCSCSPVKLDSAYKYATVVFRGKVTELIKNQLHNDIGASPIIVNLKIVKTFKMINKREGDQISIIYNHEPCEYYLEEGREYVVFGYDMGTGLYSISICSPTSPADEFSELNYERLISLSDSIPKKSHDYPGSAMLLDSASYKAMISENNEMKLEIKKLDGKIKLLIYSLIILMVLSITFIVIQKRKLSS